MHQFQYILFFMYKLKEGKSHMPKLRRGDFTKSPDLKNLQMLLDLNPTQYLEYDTRLEYEVAVSSLESCAEICGKTYEFMWFDKQNIGRIAIARKEKASRHEKVFKMIHDRYYPVTKSEITRALQSIPSEELDQCLAKLIADKRIEEHQRESRGGRPATIYQAVKYEE